MADSTIHSREACSLRGPGSAAESHRTRQPDRTLARRFEESLLAGELRLDDIPREERGLVLSDAAAMLRARASDGVVDDRTVKYLALAEFVFGDLAGECVGEMEHSADFISFKEAVSFFVSAEPNVRDSSLDQLRAKLNTYDQATGHIGPPEPPR